MPETTIRDGVLQVATGTTRWLTTGHQPAFSTASAAYNISVPAGFDCTDLEPYKRDRRQAAGFTEAGPALLTGVDLAHARGATAEPVTVYATVGLSNPAALSTNPPEAPNPMSSGESPDHAGTVNLLVHVDRALDEGGLTTLLAEVIEAKTGTLLSHTTMTGTTTDAVIVGANPSSEPATFTGSATTIGANARACVRDAVTASLTARYPAGNWPESVADADHGSHTPRKTTVFDP